MRGSADNPVAVNLALAPPPQPNLEPDGYQTSNSVGSVSDASSSGQPTVLTLPKVPPHMTAVPSQFRASPNRPDDVPARLLSLEDKSETLIPIARHGVVVAQPGRTVHKRLRACTQIECPNGCPDEPIVRPVHALRTGSSKKVPATSRWQKFPQTGQKLAEIVHATPSLLVGCASSTATAGAVALECQPLTRHSAPGTRSSVLPAVALAKALSAHAQAVMERLRLRAEHRRLLQAEHMARSSAAVWFGWRDIRILDYQIQHAQSCILSSPVAFVYVHKDQDLGIWQAC